MNKFVANVVLACVAGMLAGCGVLWPGGQQAGPAPAPPQPASPRQAPVQPLPPRRAEPVQAPAPAEARAEPRINEGEQLGNLIGYVQQVAGMHPEEQRRELAGANQVLAREGSLLARLRVALLLGTPGLGVWDDARALALLEPLGSLPPGTAAQPGATLRRFAAWLHAQVAERLREQRRATQLREQLDALKAMERSLLERGQGRNR